MAAANTSSVSLTPTSSAFRPVLLYDKNAPPTIVASVATARPPADGSYSPGDYIEFHVACASPCPVDFPPQTVTQKSGSIWGGNHVVAGTTTAWDCILGTNIYNVNDFGNCYTTTLSSGEPLPTSGSYTQVGTCQIFARSKMMFVTAGFDEYFKVMPPETRKPDSYESYVTSELSSAGCPSSAYPTVPPATESKLTSTTTTKVETATPTSSSTLTKSEAVKVPGGKMLLTFMMVWTLIVQS